MKSSDSDTIAKILLGVVSAKFGPGALGRIGTIAIAAFVVLAVLAIVFAFINVYLAGAIAVLDAMLAFWVTEKAFRYAERHPELAAMDGTQVSKLMTHQASMRQLDGLAPPPTYIEATIQNPMIAGREKGE